MAHSATYPLPTPAAYHDQYHHQLNRWPAFPNPYSQLSGTVSPSPADHDLLVSAMKSTAPTHSNSYAHWEDHEWNSNPFPPTAFSDDGRPASVSPPPSITSTASSLDAASFFHPSAHVLSAAAAAASSSLVGGFSFDYPSPASSSPVRGTGAHAYDRDVPTYLDRDRRRAP
ncbi:hypothetical protein EUX98_g9094, partial [Antrodiella citrinella]